MMGIGISVSAECLKPARIASFMLMHGFDRTSFIA